MNIVFVTRESAQMPAARIRCHGFVRVLRREGVTAEVFSYADDLGAKHGKEERLMNFGDKLLLNIRAYQRLGRRCATIVMQRCNYHSLSPALLNVLKRFPLVLDLDDWEARENIRYYYGSFANSGAVTAQRFIARRSRLCIGASRFLCDFLAQDNKNVVYAPTGVDERLFMPPPDKRDSADIVLSWIGTMHRPDNVENIRFLVECYRELRGKYRNIRLEIAGDGLYGDQVRGLVRNTDAAGIRLIPWMEPMSVPEYLATVDIGVMPLIQDTYFNKAKSPTRLFEYMSMEKPVVASAIGEAPEIVQDGRSGFIAKDKKEFVDRIAGLIKDKKLRDAVGKKARERIVAEYTLELAAKKVMNALKSL